MEKPLPIFQELVNFIDESGKFVRVVFVDGLFAEFLPAFFSFAQRSGRSSQDKTAKSYHR